MPHLLHPFVSSTWPSHLAHCIVAMLYPLWSQSGEHYFSDEMLRGLANICCGASDGTLLAKIVVMCKTCKRFCSSRDRSIFSGVLSTKLVHEAFWIPLCIVVVELLLNEFAHLLDLFQCNICAVQ